MSKTNVMITIKAPSKEEAMKSARKIENFAVDEAYGANLIEIGTFVVRGIFTGDIPSTLHVSSDPGIGIFGA